ncbi:hypothetical protein MNBD_DELTA01-602 [hydrothermal vent metagenome]|uniref:Uncharacterized protein n=1 Tax=hydrothermal vent metagenome TaxID=652676 RepID=A0A3B0QR01_9ZZZZ
MKKFIFVILLMTFFATSTYVQAEANKSPQPYLFKAGDLDIFIPAPSDKFVEVGYANKGFLWEIVRSKNLSNGLFVLKTDFSDVMDGLSNLDIEYSTLSKYARIQIQEDIVKLDNVAFKAIVDKAKAEVGDSFATNRVEPEKMLIKRVKALDLKSSNLQTRTSLGRLFSKPDAYGYGVLIKVKPGNDPSHTKSEPSYIVAGFTMIHVNEKLISTYLYAKYEGKDTLKWLQKTTEDWSDAILKANK